MSIKTSFANLCDVLKTLLDGKVDKVTGKGLSTNDYTTAEKTKLSGIAEGANKYSLPTASSSTLGGVKVGTNLSISSGVLSAKDTTYSAATASTAGLMSASDKSKLDGIATGANKYALPTATSTTLGGVKVDVGLNKLSKNPVENAAVANQFQGVASDISGLNSLIKTNTTSISDIKAKTINGVALSSGQNLIVPRSSKNLLATQGVDGTGGYIKFATITAKGQYADQPHYFKLHMRNETVGLTISLLGTNQIVAKVSNAVVTTGFSIFSINIYYVNSSDTTIDLYFKKRNDYDSLFVEDYLHADKFEGARDKVEFKSEFTTTLPENAVLIPTKADPDKIAADVASLQTKTADTGWKTTGNLKYRKSGYIVGLQGTVTSTASTMSIILGTLPEGCRPSQDIYIAQSHTDTPSRRLIIDTKGVVTMLFSSNCTASHSYAYNGIFML